MVATLALVVPPAGAAAPLPAYDPVGQTLAEIQGALTRGQVTSEQLVRFYEGRIAAYDDAGPTIGAITRENPRALADAKRLDARRGGAKRGTLYGIPFVVKENYDVVGMPTTGGSVALQNNYPARNATVVQRLVDRGAIVLAKTHMSELAAGYGRSGYSSAGGLTLNPFNLRRNPAGSSSGTGAAVAADFAPYGLATDTSGSIRDPASANGQVGLRPTRGLTSRAGVIPLSLTADVTGAIAHTAADEATVLQAMAGADRRDATTRRANAYRSFAGGLSTATLRGARIGVVEDFYGGNDEVDATVQAAIDKMRTAGATTTPIRLGARFDDLSTDVLTPVGNTEFASQFETYLKETSRGVIHTIEQLIAISRSPGVRRSTTPVNPGRIGGYVTARNDRGQIRGRTYRRLTRVVLPRLRHDVQALMRRRNLDALVFPTLSCVAAPRFDRKDPTYKCRSKDSSTPSYVASATGLPELTLPAGADRQGLPIGVSFLGRRFRENEILRLGAAWERLGGVALAPPTVPR